MGDSKTNLGTLDYASPIPRSTFDRPAFRWGIVSLTCSIFAAAGIPFCILMGSPGVAYAVLEYISLAGLIFAVGGACQRSGRLMAIVGGIISIVSAILISGFAPA